MISMVKQYRWLFAAWLALAVVSHVVPGSLACPAVRAAEVKEPVKEPAAEAGKLTASAAAAPSVPAAATPAAASSAAPAQSLTASQQELAAEFKDLEGILMKMRDQIRQTDPNRAALIEKALKESGERRVETDFQDIVELLRGNKYGDAARKQDKVDEDLDVILKLLQNEDRKQRIQDDKALIRKYLNQLNGIIREQKDVQGRTAGGEDPKSLSGEQGALAQRTGGLSKDIREGQEKAAAAGKEGEKADSKNGGNQSDGKADGKPDGKADGKPDGKSDGKSDGKADGDKSGKSDGKDPKSSAKDPSKPGDKNDKNDGDKGEKDKADKGDNSDGKSKGQPAKSDGKGQSGKSEGKPQGEGKSQGKQGQQGQGQGQGQGQDQSQDQNDSPQQAQNPNSPPQDQNPISKRLQAAQEHMEAAKKNLEKAKKDGATDEQTKALRELDTAKAELEEILRQLREEEMKRLLAQLEARFLKVLQVQREIYDGTVRLDKIPVPERSHAYEIDTGRLSNREAEITAEVEKALSLLREDGSSVAMPEAVQQVHDDMQQLVHRLAEGKSEVLTQNIEIDVIRGLEEIVDALKKAQKDSKKKPPQGPTPNGQPQDPPLIEQLAELKMIRALQNRVNTRTERYSKLIDGEQADKEDVLDALRRLSEQEARVQKVTRDLELGKNE
jgi:hypothetical protein